MDFDVSRKEITRAVSIVRNMFTATELKNSLYSMVELQVDEEGAQLVLDQDDIGYRVEIDDVIVNIPGCVQLDIHFLWDALKSFNADSPSINISLFDDKAISLIGTAEAEELIAIEKDQILDIATPFEKLKGDIVLDREELYEQLHIAKKMNRKTFHPSTEAIGIWVSRDICLLRSYNFTTFYQGSIQSKTSCNFQYFALPKKSTARLFRMLKSIKDSTVSIFVEDSSGYFITDSVIARVPIDISEDIKETLHSINMKSFSEAIIEFPIDAKTWLRALRDNKLNKPTIVAIDTERKDMQYLEKSSSKYLSYPFNRIMDLVASFSDEIMVGIGTKENLYPLILKQEKGTSLIKVIQMGSETNLQYSSQKVTEKTA